MRKSISILAAVGLAFSLTASSCATPETTKERQYKVCVEAGGDYRNGFFGPSCDLPNN